MAMTLDACENHIEGVRAISKRVREAGATEEEILETVEVVESSCGLQGLAAASEALQR